MQLLILFCLQTDLMNLFIFSGFNCAFAFIHIYMATVLQFLKFQLLRFVITFIISVIAPIIVLVAGGYFFIYKCSFS